MIIVVLLTTPLQCAGEEYGTRGLINRLLGSYGSARVSFWIGAIGSSVVFMLLHAAQDPYLNAFYFTFGMTACWMAWRTGGLEASIAMHVVNNVLAMSVLPFSDFSGIFERGAGSANALELVPLALVMIACVGIVEWQVRRKKPVADRRPGRHRAAAGGLHVHGSGRCALMGLFSNPSSSDDLEIRVARLEAQVAALMPLLDIDQTPTTWQQQAAPAPASSPTLPVVDADVARILARGNKIEAIKVARDKYGLGLKEAKDYVEGMPDLR